MPHNLNQRGWVKEKFGTNPEWMAKRRLRGRLVLCRHFGFPAYFGTSSMGLITQILNQLVDHQINTGTQCMHSPDELGAGAARARPIPILHSFLSPILSLSLLGNHEEYSRTGLRGEQLSVLEISLIQPTIFLKQIVNSAHSIDTV